MTPNAITYLFKEAHDTFPPLEGKPFDNDLLAIQETLLPLLMVIPYNQLSGLHSLTAILTKAVKYKAKHGAKFLCLACLPLHNKTIADNATKVVCVHAEATHKSLLDDYASYQAAKQGVAKFLRNVVNEIWYNDLKHANTFYTKVAAINIMALLDANSGGLPALDKIRLRTDMTQYYLQANGIPQFIMIEDAQKKATPAGMLIANIQLIMKALAAVLAAQRFPCEVDDWEGLPSLSCTWPAWKVALRLAHLERQRQLPALVGGEPLGGAYAVIPTATPTIDCIGAAHKNLALGALNDTTILEQLMAANLALTASVTLLMAANNKLADALTRNKGGAAPAAAPAMERGCMTNKPFPVNYCRTCGHWVNQNHTSVACGNKAARHKDDVSSTNTMGSSNTDKGWSSCA
jgi:hypothetical protein